MPSPEVTPTPAPKKDLPKRIIPQEVIDAVDNSDKGIKRIITYNEKGLKEEEKFFFFHNGISSHQLIDEQGNVLEAGKYDYNYEMYKYTYDAQGNLLTKVWSWEKDNSEYNNVLMETNTYDAYGRLIKKVFVLSYYFNPDKGIYDFDNLSNNTYYYSYDDNQNIIEEIHDSDGYDKKICFEYDDHNRRIKQIEYEYPDISAGSGEMVRKCTYTYYSNDCFKEYYVEFYDCYRLLMRFYDDNRLQFIQEIDSSDEIERKTVCEFSKNNEDFEETYYYYENGRLIDQHVIFDSDEEMEPDNYYYALSMIDLFDLLGIPIDDSDSDEDSSTDSDNRFIQYYDNGNIKCVVEYLG